MSVSMYGIIIIEDLKKFIKGVVFLITIDYNKCTGMYEFPIIDKVDFIPKNLIPFNYAMTEKKPSDKWVHFFIDDYQFERVWNKPSLYLPILKRFEGIITTNFSMFTHMPKAVQIWNCYRNRVIASWLQSENVSIVPCIEWSDKESLNWCLDGIPLYSTIALGNYGCNKSCKSRYNFLKGLEYISMQLQPKTIICYGNEIKSANTLHKNIIWYENYCQVMKKRLADGR